MSEKIHHCWFCKCPDTEIIGTPGLKYVGCPLCNAESPTASTADEAIHLHNNPKGL